MAKAYLSLLGNYYIMYITVGAVTMLSKLSAFLAQLSFLSRLPCQSVNLIPSGQPLANS